MAIYFIRQGKFVKIGHAVNVKGRLADVQTASPLPVVLLGVINTNHSHRLEGILHHKFREYHQRGEWYRLTPALLTLIEAEIESPEPINVIEHGEPIGVELLSWIRARRVEIDAMRDNKPIPPKGRPPIQLEMML